MAPRLALIACAIFVGALLVADRRWRAKTSIGLWIPLAWVLILGSRPVSSWFSFSSPADAAGDYLEGSPADRLVFQALIVAGLLVLHVRQVRWSAFWAANRWLLVYFAFFGLSVLWSDYTYISFKRWIKDFGNIVMVLVVLTEKEPMAALKALMLRCSYVLIPFSVVAIKYFPEIGRYYDQWGTNTFHSGVATDKNLLGMTVATSATFMLWSLIELRDEAGRRRAQRYAYLLLALAGWLLLKAGSATAMACTGAAAIVLFTLRYERVRNRIYGLATIGTVGVVLLVVIDSLWGIRDVVITALGRDPSLTGRTDIWAAVLNEKTNPLVGTGFYSFWLGDRGERLSLAYHYVLNEAHNGFLELYLNGGFVGLFLFLMMIWSAYRKSLAGIRQNVNPGWHCLQLAFVIFMLGYCLSEAVVSRLNLVWFGLLLVTSIYPGRLADEAGLSRRGATASASLGSRQMHARLPVKTAGS